MWQGEVKGPSCLRVAWLALLGWPALQLPLPHVAKFLTQVDHCSLVRRLWVSLGIRGTQRVELDATLRACAWHCRVFIATVVESWCSRFPSSDAEAQRCSMSCPSECDGGRNRVKTQGLQALGAFSTYPLPSAKIYRKLRTSTPQLQGLSSAA